MHTRWSIAVFLFWGLISSGLLLLPVMTASVDEKGGRFYRLSLLAAGISGCVAVAAVALSLNSPANLINILGKPWAGLSSAIIAQIVVVLIAVIGLLKGDSGQRNIAYCALAVAVYALFCLFRMYIISTRPALNSLLLLVLFLLLAMQLSLLVRHVFGCELNFGFSYQRILYPVVSVASGVCLLAFAFRLMLLTNPDRIFTFSGLVSGIYAPLFWPALGFLCALPVIHAVYCYIQRSPSFSGLILGFYLVGLMIFCGLINQMPTIVNSRLVQ